MQKTLIVSPKAISSQSFDGVQKRILNKISKNPFKSIKKKFGLLKTYDKYQNIIKQI